MTAPRSTGPVVGEDDRMRLAVYGAGGVGGYFGGRLAESGNDVTLIARGPHLAAIKASGLRIEDPDGETSTIEVDATDDPAEVGPVDCVVVAVKAWQVPEVARRMRPLLGPGTFVVPLQNGVEAPSQLAAEIGEERVLGGFCAIIAFLDGPGRIKHAGYEPQVAFGELDNSPTSRVDRLRRIFTSSGIDAVVPDDIHAAMWRKFLFIASFGGVGAVTRAPAGLIRSTPATRTMLIQTKTEILRVARGLGVNLPDDSVTDSMAIVDSLPEDGTASMQRDIIEGRPSELDAQTGAIVRFGRQAGVDTPVNSFIYAALLPLENVARGEA